MRFAYVDTSWLLAVAFGEPGAGALAARLQRYDRLFSSNLLEAELRSALLREGCPTNADPLLSRITWIFPDHALTAELGQILTGGYLKGADLWHIACALFLAPDGKGLAFLTLDRKQKEAAFRLGFSN